MGSYFSQQSEESSSDSSEGDYDSDSSEMDRRAEDMAADAATTITPLTEARDQYCFSFQITEAQVERIQNYLDTYEKVSLTYLLYEDTQIALQHVQMLLSDENFNNLIEWVKCEHSSDKRWQEKLVEALTIIQNYEVLKELGYIKRDMYNRFLPLIKTCTVYVNPLRKCLYRMCEDFTNNDTQEFLAYVRKDLEDMPDFNTNGDVYLERYLLHLEMQKYIDCKNVDKIIKICKYMGKDNLINELETFSPIDSSDEQFVLEECDKTPSISFRYKIRKQKTKKPQPMAKSDTSSKLESDWYNIDPRNPGVLIIINNEYFYSDFRMNLEDLLPSPEQLGQREGTKEDKKALKETFQHFGFKIIEYDNLTHEQILDKIVKVVHNIKEESSVFITILSHGSEGAVFGSNSIPVKVQDIQNVMCSSVLAGKPKVLILQCCQGTEALDLSKNDDLAIDGPSGNFLVPKIADLLVFWATVPGYSAIRHKKSGSWFIQTLCKKLKTNPTHHFLDLCVRVQNEVGDKRWEDKVMVPRVDSTFSKFLYLFNSK